jgi:glycerol-3-phosphate acyltransferase PlsX
MRIALDAMGGDHAPGVTVEGAVAAARAHRTAITLVGPRPIIEAELARHQTSGLDLTIVEADETIGMDEHAAQAVRRKPNSSIAVATRLVKEGQASAVVSAGNSGAMMAAALFVLGRVRGIDRPAIATVFPCTGGLVLLVDVGAITDPEPANMVQFAQMGDIYLKAVFGVAAPRVGLLSNGEEPTKGSKLVQETHMLLKDLPGITFIGNVEGKDVPAGVADLVVCDGYAGNVLIKTAEGVATYIRQVMRDEVTRTPWHTLLAAGLRGAFKRVGARLDYAEFGGAPLLGVEGVVIIAHGRSNARAIESALRVARQAAEQDIVGAMRTLRPAPAPTPEPSA